eukprot:15124598-Ditylum_brightwellii.AAC.1
MSRNAARDILLMEQEWQDAWEGGIDKDRKQKASNIKTNKEAKERKTAKVKNKASGEKRGNEGQNNTISKRVNGGKRGVMVQHVLMDTGPTVTDVDR